MEDNSDTVNLQLRVGNNIFKATVSSNAVAEILMHKEKSQIIELIRQGTPDSMVVGKFKEKVEIMSVTSIRMTTEENNPDNIMEVEVC